jgi:predicted MPP superfamily phosphohydrolase
MPGRPPQARRPRWKRWWVLALAIFVVVAGIIGYAYGETYRLEVKQFTVTSSQVPAAFDGTRIVFLTDIHRGWFFSQHRVGKLVDRVNAFQPDLVVMGGDYVYANIDYEASCFAELTRLQAPLGRFAVLGNHDYGEYGDGADGDRGADAGGSDGNPDPTPAIQAIQGAGITLLNNAAVWVEKAGERIRVGGVGDYQEDTPEYLPTVDGTGTGDFIILISHNPDYAEELPIGAVDLVLSGHTHGGQVTFFGLWAPYLPSEYGQKYRSGLVVTEATTVIVSSGVGTIFPPLRLFARPQIVEITLRSGPSAALQP